MWENLWLSKVHLNYINNVCFWLLLVIVVVDLLLSYICSNTNPFLFCRSHSTLPIFPALCHIWTRRLRCSLEERGWLYPVYLVLHILFEIWERVELEYTCICHVLFVRAYFVALHLQRSTSTVSVVYDQEELLRSKKLVGDDKWTYRVFGSYSISVSYDVCLSCIQSQQVLCSQSRIYTCKYRSFLEGGISRLQCLNPWNNPHLLGVFYSVRPCRYSILEYSILAI